MYKLYFTEQTLSSKIVKVQLAMSLAPLTLSDQMLSKNLIFFLDAPIVHSKKGSLLSSSSTCFVNVKILDLNQFLQQFEPTLILLS